MVKESDLRRGIGRILCNKTGNSYCILNVIRLYSADGGRLFILVLLDLDNKIVDFSPIICLIINRQFSYGTYGTTKGLLYFNGNYETNEDLLKLNILPAIITFVRRYTGSLMRIFYQTKYTMFNKIPKYKIIMRDLLRAYVDPTSYLLVQI